MHPDAKGDPVELKMFRALILIPRETEIELRHNNTSRSGGKKHINIINKQNNNIGDVHQSKIATQFMILITYQTIR